jgi:hypothetical protein
LVYRREAVRRGAAVIPHFISQLPGDDSRPFGRGAREPFLHMRYVLMYRGMFIP